mgnify:CR=1 FL=1
MLCVSPLIKTSYINLTSLSGLKEVNIEKVHVVTSLFHGDGIDVVVVVRAVCAPQVDLRAVCAGRRRIRAVCEFCRDVMLRAVCATTTSRLRAVCVLSKLLRVLVEVIFRRKISTWTVEAT